LSRTNYSRGRYLALGGVTARPPDQPSPPLPHGGHIQPVTLIAVTRRPYSAARYRGRREQFATAHRWL